MPLASWDGLGIDPALLIMAQSNLQQLLQQRPDRLQGFSPVCAAQLFRFHPDGNEIGPGEIAPSDPQVLRQVAQDIGEL